MTTPADLPVERYAGIRAALAEGHALEAVLAQEGVPAGRWPDIDLALTDALTKDEALFTAYCGRLVEAEDHLDRKVEPLAADLGAWVGFVAALGTSAGLLDRHGLRPTDVGRLQRKWQRRMEGDKALGKQAEQLASKPPPPPPKIEVDPPRLSPFPWTLPADAHMKHSAPAEEPAASAPAEPGAPGVRVEEAGQAPAPRLVVPSYLMEPRREAPPPVAVHIEPRREVPPVGLRAAAPLEPVAGLGQTAAGASPPSGEVLPFQAGPPSAEVLAPRRSLEPVASFGETAAASDQPAGPALPFDSPGASGGGLEPVAALGGTRVGALPASGPALPFEGAPPASASAASGGPASGAARKRPSLEPLASLGETAPVSGKPQGPALPFGAPAQAEGGQSVAGGGGQSPAAVQPPAGAQSPAGAQPPAAVQPPAGAQSPPRGRLEPVAALGGTQAAAPPPSGPVLPFGGNPGAAHSPSPAAPAAPPRRPSLEPVDTLGATVAAPGPRPVSSPPVSSPPVSSPPVSSPPVSLSVPSSPPVSPSPPPPARWSPEDYGRFCAELDAAPDRAAFLRRWSVASDAHLASLQAEWRGRFVADASLRDRFVAAMKQFRGAGR